MSRWKPARARKKDAPPASKGRLISCLVLLAGAIVLFVLLFSAALHR